MPTRRIPGMTARDVSAPPAQQLRQRLERCTTKTHALKVVELLANLREILDESPGVMHGNCRDRYLRRKMPIIFKALKRSPVVAAIHRCPACIRVYFKDGFRVTLPTFLMADLHHG